MSSPSICPSIHIHIVQARKAKKLINSHRILMDLVKQMFRSAVFKLHFIEKFPFNALFHF